MNTKQIKVNYSINRMSAVDLVSVIHIDDTNTRFIEIVLSDQGSPFPVTGSTVIARFVTTNGVLLNDNVSCTVTQEGAVLVPIDAAAVNSVECDLKIEVKITKGDKVLTLPFPLWVRVRGSILEHAHISPESQGTIPELLREVERELERVEGYIDEEKVYEILDATFSGDRSISPTLLVDNIVNQEHNPNGDLIMYYIDSDEVRHNIFDFTPYLGTYDYTKLTNKPAINNVPLFGNRTANELQLLYYGVGRTLEIQDNLLSAQKGIYTLYHLEDYGHAYPEIGDCLLLNLISHKKIFEYNPQGTDRFGYMGIQIKLPPVLDKDNPPKPLYRYLEVSDEQNPVFSSWREINLEQPVISSAVVNQNGTITLTLSDNSTVTTTGQSVIGPQGPAGQNYTLTAQDKTDIANIVLGLLPTTQGVQYGNSSN